MLDPPSEGEALVQGDLKSAQDFYQCPHRFRERYRAKRTSIMTGSVCVPQIDEDIGERFARIDVNHSDVHELIESGVRMNERLAQTREESLRKVNLVDLRPCFDE